MASSAERFHIVLSREEKERWIKRGAAAGHASTGDYVRSAVAAFDEGLSRDEIHILQSAAEEAVAALERIAALVEGAVGYCRRPLDEDGMRARAADRLALAPIDLDPARLDFDPAR